MTTINKDDAVALVSSYWPSQPLPITAAGLLDHLLPYTVAASPAPTQRRASPSTTIVTIILNSFLPQTHDA